MRTVYLCFTCARVFLFVALLAQKNALYETKKKPIEKKIWQNAKISDASLQLFVAKIIKEKLSFC